MRFLHRLQTWLTELFGTSQEQYLSRIDFEKLQQTLQYRIKHRQYFFEALTHRSYLQVPNGGATVSNERLEFLGDAILNFVVAEFLFKRHSSAPEGDLTKVRSRLVNRKALIAYADELRLSDFILVSSNASQLAGKGLETMLSDAFEAVIGAMYLDGGYRAACDFIERHISGAMERGSINTEDENYKSRLLEFSQAGGLGIPQYTIVNEEGPDHDRVFTVEVYVGGNPLGTGLGKNKKDAEQQAAEKALQKLQLL